MKPNDKSCYSVMIVIIPMTAPALILYTVIMLLIDSERS